MTTPIIGDCADNFIKINWTVNRMFGACRTIGLDSTSRHHVEMAALILQEVQNFLVNETHGHSPANTERLVESILQWSSKKG